MLICDSTEFTTLSVNQIKSITFTDHITGLAYGIVIGFGCGAVFGLLTEDKSSDMSGMGVLAFAGAGLIVGSIYGAFTGIDRNYIFISSE